MASMDNPTEEMWEVVQIPYADWANGVTSLNNLRCAVEPYNVTYTSRDAEDVAVLAPSWAPSWARNVPAMALAPVVDPLAPDVSTQLAPAPKRRLVAKNHDCEHCAKRFNSASALTQHVRVHTQEKPFACTRPACGKCFSQEANLRVHVDWHNGVKHPCATCPLVFDNRSNLLKHLRTAEACGGKKTAPCEVCGGAGFCSPYELKRHFKTSTHKKRKAAQAFSSCE